MNSKGILFLLLSSLVWSGCAGTRPFPHGRLGELRGRIVEVNRERGVITVLGKQDEGNQRLQLKPFTSVIGPIVTKADQLKAGQRVYVRYLLEPRADPPEAISITVLYYGLEPRGRGPGGFTIISPSTTIPSFMKGFPSSLKSGSPVKSGSQDDQ